MSTLEDDLATALDGMLGKGHNVSVDALVAVVEQRRCGSCKHWEQDKDKGHWKARPDMGTCQRWSSGYERDIYRSLPADGCHVENDEGWGNMVGAQFGCVLWEAK